MLVIVYAYRAAPARASMDGSWKLEPDDTLDLD
jgi:hypothetical protein